MKIGQAVRVIACVHGHPFAIGDIVYRAAGTGDDHYCLGFKNSSGEMYYMTDDEYEYEQVVSLDEDICNAKCLREEAVAFLERYISKNEIFQAAIDAVAETGEEVEYLRSLTVVVELY